jgi:thiol:disulfide interchange protein
MYKLMVRTGIPILLIYFCSCKACNSYQSVTKFDPARDAAQDIAAAVNEARRSGRHVILDVGGDWCIWCRRLDQFFEQNRDISEYMQANYVVVKINWSEENKNEAVLSAYPQITGYPHLFVLDAQGRLLHSQDTGLLESVDHHDRDKVMAFLQKWARRAE